MSSSTKIFLIIILTVFTILLLLSNNANPDFAGAYPLKRAQEKIYLSLKTDPVEKVDYYNFLLERRLRELKNIVENKKNSYVLSAASRYSATAGELTNYLLQNNLIEQKDTAIAQFTDHQPILNNLVEIYPKKEGDEEWKYIQDDVNYLKLYLDKLKSQ